MYKRIGLIFALLISISLFGISENDFVLNVVNENGFVKEIDNIVVIPFESEYKLLIKNNNNRDCTAKIWIDGALVSNFGDFIIRDGEELNLERFVTESMKEGKKFKFVTLDNPEVDDPLRKDNGMIKVEFRLEKQQVYIVPKNEVIPWYLRTYTMPCSGSVTTILDCSSDMLTTSTNVSCVSPGATIGGSSSGQSFYYANLDVEDKTTVLELRMQGI